MVGEPYCNIKIRLKLDTIVTRNNYPLSEDTSKNLMRLDQFAVDQIFSSDCTFANLVPYRPVNINIQMLEQLLEEARFSE